MTRIKKNYLSQHTHHMKLLQSEADVKKLGRGQVVSFKYKTKDRWVFVVDPDWNKLLHGLDLNFVPKPLLETLLDAPTDLIEEEFYRRYVSTLQMRKLDAYRTYDPKKVINLKVYSYFGYENIL